MSMRLRLRTVWVAAGCAAAAGCHDGLIHAPAPPDPVNVMIAATVGGGAGGNADAYARLDQLMVRFRNGDALRLEELLPFDPSGSETRVAIPVPLRAISETLTLELELRMGAQPLFRGAAPVALTAGRATTVQVATTPVIASVRCAGERIELSSYGDVAQVPAVALFASGDVIDEPLEWSWSATDGTVVRITDGTSNTAQVEALTDGTAQLSCSAGGMSDDRAVRVFAIVRAVAVTPAEARIVIGSTAAFSAVLRDANQNVITGRVVNWSTATPAVAAIAANGVATAITPGTTIVTAAAGEASGDATLTVVLPDPPVVSTAAATNISTTGAVLNGTANPGGFPAEAWFEWGQDPTLTSSTATARQSIGSGSAAVARSAPLGDLTPGVTYYFRHAASNIGGTSRGPILSFRTHAPPTAVTLGAEAAEQSAVLAGQVNPNGFATQAWFEWGEDASLATFTATAAQSVGSGSADVAQSWQLAGLEPGRTYYFRQAASNIGGTARGQILSFTVPRPPTAETHGAEVEGPAATLHGQVSPNGEATSAWFEWGQDPDLGQFDATAPQSISGGTTTSQQSAQLDGLAPGRTYYFRQAASNIGGTAHGQILSFTVPRPPTAETLGADVVELTATLYGQVSPNGEATSAWFEWGQDPDLEQFDTTAPQSISGGTTTSQQSAQLNRLAPATYYFRQVASNSGGTAYGQILSFEVRHPPTAETLGAEVAGLTATLYGRVSPNGELTSAWFEWGQDPALGQFDATAPQAISGDTTTSQQSAQLAGLAQETTYYFRQVASNAGGTAYGQILSFTTPRLVPVARMISAEWVPDSDAQLQLTGGVTPNGVEARAWFEWEATGPGTFDGRVFGSSDPVSVGSGFTEVQITASPFMGCYTYDVRVAVAGGDGVVYSNIFQVGLYPGCTILRRPQPPDQLAPTLVLPRGGGDGDVSAAVRAPGEVMMLRGRQERPE
jgi:phosphodiesterase/alkaline phosphatase D-like protein